MLETIVSILGYLAQAAQVLGLRVSLLLGTIFYGGMSYFTLSQHLYANFAIRAIAGIICLLGFFKWNVSVYRFKAWHMFPYILVVICVGILMVKYTNDPTPILDTIIASMGLIATFLLAVRSIFNWIFLFIINVLEIIMFSMNHDYQIVIMETVFAISSIIGIIIWRYRGIDKSREKGSFFKLNKK